MLPLGFNDLAGSPTIVLSPHQHPINSISSRAAHSIYYHQPCKPLMPTRHWDHPVAMSKAVPMTGIKAQKRNRDDEEQDDVSEQWLQIPKTLHVSPDNAAQGGGTAPINHLSNDQMDLETRLLEKSSGNPKALTASEAEDRSISPLKRQRLQTATADTGVRVSEELDFNSWEVLLGPGWTAVEETGHEGYIFRQFTDVVRDRFSLPGRIHWIAKNRTEGLMLAHSYRGACYFDSMLSRSWLVATSLGVQKKCREVFAGEEACEEPVLNRHASEPDSRPSVLTHELGEPYIGKPPAEWLGVDYMSRLDAGRRICSQTPTPARRNNFPPSPSSNTNLDDSGDQPQEPVKSDCSHAAEAMELD